MEGALADLQVFCTFKKGIASRLRAHGEVSTRRSKTTFFNIWVFVKNVWGFGKEKVVVLTLATIVGISLHTYIEAATVA